MPTEPTDHAGVRCRYVEALAARAAADPNGPALTDLSDTWTWQELAAHAATLANELLSTTPETVVGVLLDRRIRSVAAVFATMWAGRALVPLDVNDPAARLADNCERAGVTVVIDATGRGESHVGSLAVRRPPHLLLAPEQWPAIAAPPPERTSAIFFTSGSTGRAKAVVRTYANLDDYLSGWSHTPWMTPLRSAVFLPLQFTGGYGPLIHTPIDGRFTAIVDPTELSAEQMFDALRTWSIEQIYLTPSLLRVLVSGGAARAGFGGLQRVWTVGEPLLWSDIADARSVFGEHVVFGAGYGTTESLAMRCLLEIGPGYPLGEGRVPLGRPVHPGWQRIDMEGFDDGVGELVLREPLAKGYLDDPALQAERFGMDPDGVRTWRSGDIVADVDGLLVHRGRIDDMVKISGRLVEPAETEAALRRTPGIRNSVVLVRRLASGRAQLVAHLETDDGLSAGAVLRSLRDGLPAHLVPALLVRHDRLPITDRGKVDRAALLAQPPRPWRDDTSDAAEDMLTASVVGMSRRLLELDDIGPDDNLFDLGLDSLAAIEMIAMINESTGIALDPHDFFVAETPRRIAECLQRPSTSSDPDTVILHADAPGTPVFFVAGAGGFALSYRTLALELGPAQPFVVFQQHGLTQRGRREGSIAANARRHLLALRRIRPTGPYVLAGHSWGGLVAHEMARHLAEAGEDVRLVLLDAHKPPRRLVRVRPEALRDRQTGWPLHVAKLARWRLALATRRVGDRFAKVGTARRYDAFFRLGERRMVGTTVPALAIPVLFLCAETGRPSDWDDHPQCSVRRVPGDHLTLLQPPNAAVTAAAMRSALALSP